MKSYGKRRTLDIESLEIESDNVYAILGLNGSGKSTLLQCISGIIEPDGGEIDYEGKNSLSAVKDKISIMTQNNYMFDKTVLSNIKTGLEFRKYDKEDIEKRILSYLKYFSLEPLLNKNAKKLSGGEEVKTALHRTVVLETDLTLMDEPTANMDMESNLQAERLVRSMSNNKRAVIMVTHDVYQARGL